VVVIIGNDQHEVFSERNMPAFSVFWGDAVESRPPTEAQIAMMPPGTALASRGHRPPVVTPAIPAHPVWPSISSAR
jgi:hypothetical protein